MNERERFRRLFGGQPVDRPPRLEEGIREEVIAAWRAQGLPAGRTHLELFDLTPHETVGGDLRYADAFAGRIMSLSARDYGRAFAASRQRFPADWDETVARLRGRDHVVSLWASRGFFQALGVMDWRTFEAALLGASDAPAATRERLRLYGEFCAEMLELALADLDPEIIYLSEPISDNNAPLISPQMFADLMIPIYERIVAVARAHGCTNVLVSTYGNSALLLPAMIAAGVSILWVSEADGVADVDYHRLRRRFPQLGLVGGIPLDLVRDAAGVPIEARLREWVSPLLTAGRYLPLAGGRVREEVTWPAYAAYRAALNRIVG
jgi:hypothetical protein